MNDAVDTHFKNAYKRIGLTTPDGKSYANRDVAAAAYLMTCTLVAIADRLDELTKAVKEEGSG